MLFCDVPPVSRLSDWRRGTLAAGVPRLLRWGGQGSVIRRAWLGSRPEIGCHFVRKEIGNGEDIDTI
jgi:hypothetical protein